MQVVNMNEILLHHFVIGKSTGRPCPALKTQKACPDLPKCPPVNCRVGAFGTWGTCSTTCKLGTQKRHRKILTDPKWGGRKCPHLVEKQTCNEGACDKKIDCKVTKWTQYSACSVTCGSGRHIRTRTITRHAQNGGKLCPNLREIQYCSEELF